MSRMNAFDKFCAVIAFAAGCFFLISGAFGLFIGTSAWYQLPPIMGGIPALAGWGIVKAVIVAWSPPSAAPPLEEPQPTAEHADPRLDPAGPEDEPPSPATPPPSR